ncbi:hypothetical protein SLJ66_001966 [Escherichia coli]|nr:hypothetical protein [Escherichia coli]
MRAIIGVWADEVGGDEYHGSRCAGGIWKFVTGWSGEETERFIDVFERLRKIGYTGEQLLIKAQGILWPKRSLSSMLQRANDENEADFVEKAILKSFQKDNPIYQIACKYYLDRNTVQELANYMEQRISPWLTNKQCADRVRWCIDLFNAKVYLVLQDEIEKERTMNREKEKIFLQTA